MSVRDPSNADDSYTHRHETGDTLSSILFNLIMDEVIKGDKTAKKEYRIGNRENRKFCYVVLTSKDEDNHRDYYIGLKRHREV